MPVIDGVKRLDLSFNEYCKPLTNVWNKYAEEVHKIQRGRAMTFQHPEELAEKLDRWLEQFDDIFTVMGYNCLGDKRYIERLLYKHKRIKNWSLKTHPEWKDVYDLVKKRKKMIPKKKLTLGSMCEYFGIDIDAHDALSDASTTYDVYERVKLIKTGDNYTQSSLDQGMTEVEKKRKYTDIKYMSIGSDSTVFITEYATQNKEALRIVLDQIWTTFVDSKE